MDTYNVGLLHDGSLIAPKSSRPRAASSTNWLPSRSMRLQPLVMLGPLLNLTNKLGAVQFLATPRGRAHNAITDDMLFFAKDFGLGIHISAINMISKAARVRVAKRSSVLAMGMDMIDEARNSQLALLSVLRLQWCAQWIDVSMSACVHSAWRLVMAMDRRGSLANIPYHKRQSVTTVRSRIPARVGGKNGATRVLGTVSKHGVARLLAAFVEAGRGARQHLVVPAIRVLSN